MLLLVASYSRMALQLSAFGWTSQNEVLLNVPIDQYRREVGKLRQENDTGPHQLHMDRWICCAPFERLLQMNIVEASDGEAILTMPFLVQFAQGAALLHGGALMSLADTALVMAIKSVLPPYTHFVTVHADVDYFRPVTQGTVTARAKLTNRDGRKISGETSVFDDSEEQVLRFSAIFVVAKDTRIKGVTFADSRE